MTFVPSHKTRTLTNIAVLLSGLWITHLHRAQEPPSGIAASKADLLALTSTWKGDRYPDGRPKVPDDLLRRMKAVSIEEAWEVLRVARLTRTSSREAGEMLHPDEPFVGRALTAVLPSRPARPGGTGHEDRQGRGPDRAVELLADRHAPEG